MVNWLSVIDKIMTVGELSAVLLRAVPQLHGISRDVVEATTILGGFIFIPSPSRIAVEKYHKTIEVPIIGMTGNKLQNFGVRAPRIYIEGEWMYNESQEFSKYFPNANITSYLTPDVMQLLLSKTIKLYNKRSMPFISTVLPQYRMVMVEREYYEPVEGTPRNIRYKLTLVQQERFGGP